MSGTDPFSPEQLLLQRRFVGALARRLVADAAQVDDVAQETWLELLTTKAPPRSFSWLRAVVRNVVRQLGRSEGRRRAREGEVARVAPTLAPATDEIAGRLELQRRLIERVLALPALHKEIVLLHFYEECTVKQAAARLGIPFETARTRLRRALDELRAHWNRDLGGERAGLLALVQLAPLSKVATWGAWIAMAKGSKAALAVAVVVVAAGGWWLWSGPRALHGGAPATTALVAPAGTEAADANAPLAAERVNEPAPAVAPPAALTSVDGFGSVRVHVTWLLRDSKSTPLPNVPVRLFSEERPPTFVDAVDGMTDGNGDFLADHVPSGSVIATAAGFMAFTGSSDHPSFSERPCARRIAVRANETTDVTLSVFKDTEVDGVVLDPKGAPVAGATIWISSGAGGWPSLGEEFGKSDAFGHFHLPVVERIHFIAAYAPSYAPSPAISLSGRETTNGRCAIELQFLDEGGCIRGRVVDPSARPVGHAFVYASGPWSNPRVLRKGTTGEHPPARTTRTHDDGTFEIEGAPVGEVHLVVRARDHAPVWERFTSTAGSLKEFDLTLQKGGTLEGTLETADGEPLPGVDVRVAPVQMLPEPRVEVLTAFARTNDDGHFVVEHLMAVPLEATVDAGEHGTANLAFTLADGETREWSPEFSRGLEIRGRVIDEDGAALPRWKVEARLEKYQSGVEPPPAVATASDGRFAIPRCVDKPYEVRVFESEDRPNITFSSIVLHGVKAGGEQIEIRVPANRRKTAFVAGRVVDADGRPLPRVALSLYEGGSNDISFNAGDEAGFRLGPFPPGDYHMRLWLEGLPQLELGTRTLTAGQTLDLGTLTMARPGFVEVRATRADGSPPEDGNVSIWNEARDNSEDIGLVGDLFRSAPLAPGRYQLCGGEKMASTWIPFEIVGGKTTQLALTVAPGAIRSFRLLTASGAPPVSPIEVALSDATGHPLWSHTWPKYSDGPYVVCQRFARGRFTISFTAADGAKGDATFEVEDLVDAKDAVDVTMR